MTLDEAKEKSTQAYQVIGYLDEVVCGNSDTPKPSGEEWIRAMDYFCDPDTFNEDFLPWPRSKP